MNKNINSLSESTTNERIVVVLGMHRSGTSALTKALNVLGVSLSKNLMPEGEFNPKGHWEDLDIVAINEKLLSHLDLMWFTPVEPIIDFSDPVISSLADEAVTLINKRIQMYPTWGFKDPRTLGLLPFWKAVFARTGVRVDYVFIHRNPLDICRSLHKRNDFSHRHSYALWLTHTALQLKYLSKEHVFWVTFNQLITRPQSTLERLAVFLSVSVHEYESAIDDYCKEFIDSSLSHSMTSAQELIQDREVFEPVIEYNDILELFSEGSLDFEQWCSSDEGSLLPRKLEEVIGEELLHWQGISGFVLSEYQKNEFKEQLKHSELRCEQLKADSRNRQAELNISIEELRSEIKVTHQRLSHSLDELTESRKALKVMHDDNHQKQCEIEQYREEIGQYRDKLEQSQHTLEAVYNSTSWKATKPIRRGKDLLLRLSNIPEIVSAHGGPVKIIHKAVKVFRKQGLEGLKEKAKANTEALINYGQWLSRYGEPSDELYEEMRKRIESQTNPPMISVLMPVYNPPIDYLAEAIESVRKQVYQNWQLCIADDASTDPEVWKLLCKFAKEDSRIKIMKREENGHISHTSNSALKMAEGEFIALMDHDDKLTPDALFWVSEAILKHEDAAMIYSDEDKITADGQTRYDPNFKPEWNPALFLCQNYISHLGVYRTDIARKIGGFRPGFEGAQDWDFALRFTETIDKSQIIHIPRILYHWRAIEGSTAVDEDEKPYALIAGLKAVEEHLQRQGKSAEVTKHPDRHYARVQYLIPDSAPLVSIIIPTRNGLDVLSVCIESVLERTTYPNFELIIIDNGSDCQETLDYLHALAEKESRVKVIRDESPFNYSALNNKAVSYASGEVITLLNNDIEVISPDWLTEMVGYAIQPENGAVGARLWYPDDTLQHGGVVLVGGVAGHAHKYLQKGMPGYACRAVVSQNFSAVTAACLVVRKAIFNEVSGLNETNLSVAFNDIDFCLRLQEAGYFNVWTPYAELYHYESKTRGAEDTPEKKARFQSEVQYMQERWGSLLLNDPCYNPNLTLDREDFSLAEVPRV